MQQFQAGLGEREEAVELCGIPRSQCLQHVERSDESYIPVVSWVDEGCDSCQNVVTVSPSSIACHRVYVENAVGSEETVCVKRDRNVGEQLFQLVI